MNTDPRETIRFSVVVPIYNSRRYVHACIDSVLAQTYSNYELLLVDDGSTDESGAICDSYARDYAHIRVFHKPNGGELHTRQYGVDRARGTYCVFLDSDDRLVPHALERLHEVLSQTACDCVLYGIACVQEGKTVSRFDACAPGVITDKHEIYRRCLLSADYNSMCRKAVRTVLLQGLTYEPYYYLRRGADLIQSLETLKRIRSAVFIDDVLYEYRENADSVTHTIRYEAYRVDFTVRERVAAFIEEENALDAADYKAYRSLCARLLVNRVCTIASFNVSVKKKIALFEEIRRTTHYQRDIVGGEYDKKKIGSRYLLFVLFRRRWYRTMLAVIALWQRRNRRRA